MACGLQKTYTQQLNEICVKMKVSLATYEYSVLQLEPTFVYEAICTLILSQDMKFVAIGTGKRKKDAAQLAAKSMLENELNLNKNADDTSIKSIIDKIGGAKSAAAVAAANGVSVAVVNARELALDDCPKEAHLGDPISDLMRFCKMYLLPQPVYSKTMHGPSHMPIMKYECSVGDLVVAVNTKSFKIGKRHTCYNMLLELNKRKTAKTLDALRKKTIEAIKTEEKEEDAKVVAAYKRHSDKQIKNEVRAASYQGDSKEYLHSNYTVPSKNLGSYWKRVIPSHPGVLVQELYECSKTLEVTYPMVYNLRQYYEPWLRAHDLGLNVFFESWMMEMGLTVEYEELVSNEDQDNLMSTITICIPDEWNEDNEDNVFHFNITNKCDLDKEKIREDLIIQSLSFIGTMSAKNLLQDGFKNSNH